MMKRISTIAFATALVAVVAGCATRGVAVIDAQTKRLTLNGQPIELLELIASAQRYGYGEADLVVVSTTGTKKMDLRKTTDELAFWLFLPLLAPDFDGTTKVEAAPNQESGL